MTLITSPAFVIPLLLVKVMNSSMASSHSVMGGMYKARELIHRRMATVERTLEKSYSQCQEILALKDTQMVDLGVKVHALT